MAYDPATTQEHIRAADRVAIGSFVSDFSRTGRFASAARAVGLSLKYGLESIVGPIYPRVGSPPLAKKQKMNENMDVASETGQDGLLPTGVA